MLGASSTTPNLAVSADARVDAWGTTLEDADGLQRDAIRLEISPVAETGAHVGTPGAGSIIGDTGNAASIALHLRYGFARVGTLHAVGFKLGRWVDTVLMQRALGPGAAAPPGHDRGNDRGNEPMPAP